MTDLGLTVAPKSDQINADDLISGPRTIKVTRVTANPSSGEQPIAIYFDGDNGKPYLPCKSMRRVLINTWGRDGAEYPGRSMTLYRDPTVKFGGLEVGGIRISHMSHIDGIVTMALTATRASRKPFTVKPLATEPEKTVSPIDTFAKEVGARLKSETDADAIYDWWEGTKATRDELQIPPARSDKMASAVAARIEELRNANSGDNKETAT